MQIKGCEPLGQLETWVFHEKKADNLQKTMKTYGFLGFFGLSPVEICAVQRLIVSLVNLAPVANRLERD